MDQDGQLSGYVLGRQEGVDGRGPEVKASSRSTAASLALYRSVVDGEGPPPHTHSREDETIFVLSGAIEAECGGDTFHVEEGGVAFLPRGLMHTFRSSGGTAEILFIVTPGHLDEFFAQRDRALAEGAAPQEIARLARSFGF